MVRPGFLTRNGRIKAHSLCRGSVTLVVAALAVVSVTVGVESAQAAEPPLLRQFCEGSQGDPLAGQGGRCSSPRGIAVDSTSGDVYVADGIDLRIQKFTAWGQFLRTWGWDVVASGPGDDTTAPEDQFEVCVPTNGDTCKRGAEGDHAGQFAGPIGVTVDGSGDVYVVDSRNQRVQKFSPEGDFLLAWGGDVVASGPSDSTNDEVQEISIAAEAGTFKLSFENPRGGSEIAQTPALPYNASATEVEAALNSLTTIASHAGSVSVSGGPGDSSGSNPYEVTFEGDLGGDDLPPLTIDRSELGQATVGARLACSIDVEGKVSTYLNAAYQWLRNGSPIAGANSLAYKTTAQDEGKAIQCQVTTSNPNGGSVQAANPVYVTPLASGIEPPVAPSSIVASKDKTLFIGSSGQTLTCDPGAWIGADSFTYGWYRNGSQIAGAFSATYVVTKADLASPALFQCAVTATNTGEAATTKFSESRTGSNELTTTLRPDTSTWIFSVTMEPPGNVVTTNQGGAPEICQPADICGPGIIGTGNGEFGAWDPEGNYISSNSNSSETIYVGDKERVQEFDTEGHYLGDLPDPENLLQEETVKSLAIDPMGSLYLSFKSDIIIEGNSKDDVLKLSPAGEKLCTLKVSRASAIATDAVGQVHVVSAQRGSSPSIAMRIVQFNAASCTQTESFDAEAAGFERSTGIATSSACGISGVDLFVGNRGSFTTQNFIRIYGSPPDIDVCPPPLVPPTIADQYAVSVNTDGATVGARINPHFWEDTSYYVQYGTGKCSEGGCEETALFPGAKLGGGTIDALVATKNVFLGATKPLTPDTTYHYRFVAQGSGGGPTIGAEGSLHTFARATEPNTECANQSLRTGSSASLPDCRAYELVSPLEKNNGDVVFVPELLDQSSPEGNRLAYAAKTAFADPIGAPFVNQYLAERDETEGWSSRSINAPRNSVSLYYGENLASRFKAFSEDLCSGWMLQDSAVPLAEGAPAQVPNLYRRDNCGEEEGSYELITPVFPPGFEPAAESLSDYWLEMQGFVETVGLTVFRAPAALTPNASAKSHVFQLYAHGKGTLHLISVLPKGEAAATHSSLGMAQGNEPSEPLKDSLHHAISKDGQRIFWTASNSSSPVSSQEGGKGTGPGALYVRVNPTQPQSKVKLSKCTEPELACTIEISKTPASFLGADLEGKIAFYAVGEELYEFNVDKALAGAKNPDTLIASDISGLLGASDDASHIYFVSSEVLSSETNSESDKAQAGKPNLYHYEAGAGGSYSFVATLSAIDVGTDLRSPISDLPYLRASRVSPDGSHAAFVSTAALTGYDNTDVSSGQPSTEVFLYDAEAGEGTGKLRCASCNPSGARPVGREIGSTGNGTIKLWAAASIPGWTYQLYPSRALSHNGQRLFFESYDALVLADTNGRRDVYQWEALDSGDCTQESPAFSPSNEGCLSLISTGQSDEDSTFVDASADGRDVFLTTASSLVPQDSGLNDIYDAREDGGFPLPEPDPAVCEGEACQGTPTPPSDPTPASSSYEGAGNLTDAPASKPRCPKGKRAIRKAGRVRCAKRPKAASRGGKQKRRRQAKNERRAAR